jgi:hypothetical protein
MIHLDFGQLIVAVLMPIVSYGTTGSQHVIRRAITCCDPVAPSPFKSAARHRG